MKSIILQPADPERDFGQIAALISSQEDEPTSEQELNEDFEKNKRPNHSDNDCQR